MYNNIFFLKPQICFADILPASKYNNLTLNDWRFNKRLLPGPHEVLLTLSDHANKMLALGCLNTVIYDILISVGFFPIINPVILQDFF